MSDHDPNAQKSTDATGGEGPAGTVLGADAGGSGDADAGKGAQGGDNAAADQGGGNAAADQGGDNAPKGAPEKYEAFKLPDGAVANTAQTEKFAELGKSLNLTQEQAQQLVDAHFAMLNTQVESHAAQLKEVEQTWLKSLETDEEFGGADFKANLVFVDKGLELVDATPEFRKLMNETRLGNHPEMVRLFYRLGKLNAEDRFSAGDGDGTTKSLAERMYPNQTK